MTKKRTTKKKAKGTLQKRWTKVKGHSRRVLKRVATKKVRKGKN